MRGVKLLGKSSALSSGADAALESNDRVAAGIGCVSAESSVKGDNCAVGDIDRELVEREEVSKLRRRDARRDCLIVGANVTHLGLVDGALVGSGGADGRRDGDAGEDVVADALCIAASGHSGNESLDKQERERGLERMHGFAIAAG